MFFFCFFVNRNTGLRKNISIIPLNDIISRSGIESEPLFDYARARYRYLFPAHSPVVQDRWIGLGVTSEPKLGAFDDAIDLREGHLRCVAYLKSKRVNRVSGRKYSPYSILSSRSLVRNALHAVCSPE